MIFVAGRGRLAAMPQHVLRRPSVAVNLGLAVLVVAAIGLAWAAVRGGATADASQTAGLRTVPVSQGTVTATVTASGSVRSASTATASFATGGTVTDIAVAVGQKVRKDQVLAHVDPRSAKRNLALAEADLTAANDALSRAQSAGSDTSSAQNSVTQARLAVDDARAAVDGTTLTAPMAGTVVAINGTVGGSSGGGTAPATAGASGAGGSGSGGGGSGGGGSGGGGSGGGSSTAGFIDLANLSKLQVTAAFAEADATRIKVGQAATVTWNALQNAQATGTVAAIDPQGTTGNNVVTYGVTVNLGALPAGAKPGQTVNVMVVTGRVQNAVYVTSAAVTTVGNRHVVTVLTGAGREVRQVELGLQSTSADQVLSGLNPGDQVVLPQVAATGNGGGFGGRGGFGGFGGAGRGGANGGTNGGARGAAGAGPGGG
jgi:membrane fusion protein, macrolide-specific efflux system